MKTLKLKIIPFLLLLNVLPYLANAQDLKPDEQKIIQQEINTIIYSDKNFRSPVSPDPNWKSLARDISKKYPGINSEKMVNGAKIRYYSLKKDWENFADAYLTSLEKYDKVGLMDNHLKLSFQVNNVLYNQIFRNVNDKNLLKRAAIQAKNIIDNPHTPRPDKPKELELSNSVDTYANLLYKSGDKAKAIKWQKMAVKYDPKSKEFKDNLAKMQRGDQTW